MRPLVDFEFSDLSSFDPREAPTRAKVSDDDFDRLAPSSLEACALEVSRFDARWAARIAALPSLRALSLRAKHIEPGALALLGETGRVRELCLRWSDRETPDEVLAEVGSFAALEGLDLTCLRASTLTAKALSRLGALRRLAIASTGITAAEIAKLTVFAALRTLELGSLALHEKALAYVGALPALERLEMNNARKLSPALFDGLAASAKLIELEIDHAPVTSAMLFSVLMRCPIESLSIGGCGGLDASVFTAISCCKTLRRLRMGFVERPDAALTALRELPSLAELDIVYARGLSQPALRGLAEIASLRAIQAQGVAVDDATLLAWVDALPLESCSVYDSAGISRGGFRQAKSRRPECVFSVSDAMLAEGEELLASFVIDGRSHDVMLDARGEAVVLDYPGDVRVVRRDGTLIAKKKLVGAEWCEDFSRGERSLLVTQNSGKSGYWNIDTNKLVLVREMPASFVAASRSALGKHVVTLDGDSVTLVSAEEGERWSVRGEHPTSAVALSADARFVAYSDARGVHVLALDGTELRLHAEGVAVLRFDEGTMLYVDRDKRVLRVDSASGTLLDTMATREGVEAVVLEGTHRPATLVGGNPSAISRVWIDELVRGSSCAPRSFARRADGSWVLLSARDRLFAELRTETQIVRLFGATRPAISGDGEWLAWPSENGDDACVRVFETRALLAFAKEHATPVERFRAAAQSELGEK